MKYTNKNLIKDPNVILREKSKLVELPLTQENIDILNGLTEYVKNSVDEQLCEKYDLSPAVGIAAVQVGILKQLCVVYLTDENGNPEVNLQLINPKIIAHSVSKFYLSDGEACLSIDEKHPGFINRYNYIKVKHYSIEGKELISEFKDFCAIAVQHEIDHLNGILYYDHINKNNPFEIESDSTSF